MRRRLGLEYATRPLLLVVAAAFGVRLIYALAFAPRLTVFGDDTFFHYAALQLADGLGYVGAFDVFATGKHLPTAQHPPLYPLALSAVARLGGRGLDAQRLVGVAAGTATVLVVGLIGTRVGGRRAGIAAAALCALYPTFIAADGALMSESLFGAIVACVLLVALRLIDRPSLVETMLLGALIGLAALTRSEGLLLLPLIAIPIAIVAAGRRLRVLAVLVGACALVLSPWVIRNWADFGRPTLSTNDGTTLAGANCQPTYYGNQIGGFSEACLGPVPAGANEAEVSSARRHNALTYAQAHLGRASVIAVVRVLRMWGFYDPLSHANLDGRSRPLSTLGALLLFPLLALGVVGAVILRHRRPLALLVLLAPVLAATVTAAATYGLLRLRHEADVAVLVFAGVAAARWRVAPISAPRPSRTTAEVDLRR